MSVDRRNALVALTAAGLIWGASVPLSKLALGWLDPLWLTVARFAVAAPILALVALPRVRGALSLRVIGWGALFYGLVVGLQNLGIERTSVSHSALILGTVPALVALTALAIGRGSAGPRAWVGFVGALVGVTFVVSPAGGSSVLGDVLVLASAAFSALFIVAQASIVRERDPIAVTAVQMAAGAIVTAPLALLFEAAPTAPVDIAGPAAFAALALVGSLLPFALYAYGQARVEPEVAGAFVNLEPLVGAVAGAALFQDPFGAPQLLGASLIVAGIALSVERLRPPPLETC
jgi:drug/metabolite transporter (DMT)-like permease